MKGSKGSTIYKSRSCDICGAWARSEGLEPEQGQVAAKLGPGWS